ncbi:hypothetical protein C8Q74DRAFT_1452465 [Fomes fomentarius]|nr:hypothetical protein C8Q74DRAFT_1452465 [Fomes fomentarius]
MDFASFIARILREYVAQYGGAIGQQALVDAESNSSCDQDHIAVREPEFFIMLPSSLVSDFAYPSVEFRVFKGILAGISPVFKDMLSLPKTADAEMPSNCPVVHVTDNAEDLRHILRLYMPKTEPSPFLPEDPMYEVTAACVRLGHKYQISKRVEHAVDYLRKCYPDNFDLFRKGTPSSFRKDHAIGVINLAHLIGANSFLPTAFLICASLGSSFVKDFERADSSREQLTPDDIAMCVDAQVRLTQRSFEQIVRVLRPEPHKECVVRASYRHALRDFMDDYAAYIAQPNPFTIACLDPLRKALCMACWAMVSKRDEDEKPLSWNVLPRFVGIEELFAQDDDSEGKSGSSWGSGA